MKQMRTLLYVTFQYFLHFVALFSVLKHLFETARIVLGDILDYFVMLA